MDQTYYWYKIYGCILRSDVEYTQLLSTEEREADIILRYIPLERRCEDPRGCYVGEITQKYIYFCNQVGTYEICEGKEIHIWPNAGVNIRELTCFVFGYCIAMLFWQRGMEAMHCSAVEMNGESLIISGYSGSGKSTLTTCLIRHGARLMTDDVAVLGIGPEGQVMVYPAFPQQKLCRDAVHRNALNVEELLYIDEDRDKFALDRREEFCDEPRRLRGIICLREQREDEQVHIREITGHEKLMMILQNLFLYPMFENSSAFKTIDMVKCLKIAKIVPVYEIARPHGIDSTEQQYAKILSNCFSK